MGGVLLPSCDLKKPREPDTRNEETIPQNHSVNLPFAKGILLH